MKFTANGRVRAIDIARALVVIGVVFNHAVDGLIGAQLLQASSPIGSLNDVLYIFRMPALVFLVGALLPAAVAKRGRWNYLMVRAALMLYLYVIWFVIEGVVETAAGGLRNGSRPLYELLFIWRPIAHLWFLPFLVVATALVLLVRPWAGYLRNRLGFILLVGLTVVAWGWNPPVIGLRGLSLVAFVALGSVVGLERLKDALRLPVVLWGPVGAVAAAGLLLLARLKPVPASQEVVSALSVHLLSICAAAIGIIFVLAVSVLLSAAPIPLGWLESVGRQTLPIYLAHVIVVAGVRILLAELIGVGDIFVILGACLVAGVAVPLVLVLVSSRLRVRGLFTLPRFLEMRLARPSSSGPRGGQA